MKIWKSVVFFSLLLPTVAFGQDYNKVYFNLQWQMCSAEKADYYRISGFSDSLLSYDGKVTDYYKESGNIQMTGNYKNGKRDSLFTFYFNNGNVKLVMEFKNGERIGNWKKYYENGILEMEINYHDGIENLIQLNNNKGKSIINNNKVIYSFDDLQEPEDNWDIFEAIEKTRKIQGNLKDGLRDGKWTVYSNGIKKASLNYNNGILEDGYIFVSGVKYKITNNLSYPLINIPNKLDITENFKFEHDAAIKNNYVLQALQKYSASNTKKIIIGSYEDFEDHINRNFYLKSYESESYLQITIYFKNQVPYKVSTKPKLSEELFNDLNMIINTIERVDFNVQDKLIIDYKIEKTNSQKY